jgi:DHA1 family inner membrane transport protein
MENHTHEKRPKGADPGFGWQVAAATLCRLILNTARRFAYPFAPVLSRGLGVSLPAITLIIAANQISALIGMLFGPLADRLGYRLMMLVGLGMLAAGMLAGGFLPYYGVVFLALLMAGLGKSIFDPALQAYVSARVPYERRGLFIGMLEFSWAGSTLIGIPAFALLIDGLGWRAPFFVGGGLGLIGMVGLGLLIPPPQRTDGLTHRQISFTDNWRQLARARPALGILGYAFWVSAANDNLFVIYGAWLEQRYSLSIVALGLGTAGIGVAELAGESLTALWADRIGLKRALTLGLVLTLAGYALLPVIGRNLFVTMTGLFVLFLSFEFTLVTSLSLSTEVLPGARATMMSAFFAAAGLGRVGGALLGGQVWLAGGIWAIALVSASMNALALVALLWGLRGWEK